MLYCFAAIVFIITLQTCSVWIFAYLGEPTCTFKWGGPTFDWGGTILGERASLPKIGLPHSSLRVLEISPTSFFEQPLRFIAHGRIFESLQYNVLGAF